MDPLAGIKKARDVAVGQEGKVEFVAGVVDVYVPH